MMQQYHVMVVAKHDDQKESQVYLIGPNWKRNVRRMAKEEFRKDYDLSPKTKLRFKFLFSGSEEDANYFFEILMRKLRNDGVGVDVEEVI